METNFINNHLAKDALTGETFGDIRIGSYHEKRLLSVIIENDNERNITGTKSFFGPLDDPDLQLERYKQYQYMSAPKRFNTRVDGFSKREIRRTRKNPELKSTEYFVGETEIQVIG